MSKKPQYFRYWKIIILSYTKVVFQTTHNVTSYAHKIETLYFMLVFIVFRFIQVIITFNFSIYYLNHIQIVFEWIDPDIESSKPVQHFLWFSFPAWFLHIH